MSRMLSEPLPDAIRGASSVAETAEDTLDQLLPELIRPTLQSALVRIEGEVCLLLEYDWIDVAETRKATAFSCCFLG